MNILFINEYIYPNVVSGAEFSMQALAKALKQKKENIIFFGPNLSKKKISSFQGIKIIRFPFIKKLKPYRILTPFWFNNPIFWFYSAVFIAFTCQKEKIEVIHVHGKYLLPGAIISRFFTKTPVIVTVRDYRYLCPLSICLTEREKKCDIKYFLKREIRLYLSIYEKNNNIIKNLFLILRIIAGKILQNVLFWFLQMSDKIICISKAQLKIYHESGISLKKLIHIYNLPPKISSYVKNYNKKTVLSVGRMSYGKGTDLLIKAMSEVRKNIPEVELALIGSKSNSIGKIPEFIRYYGQLPHERLNIYYQSSSLFVLVTRWPEPLGRASMEALSHSLPLVLSKKGANKELVINGLNGYLVPLKIKQIAQKISLILRSSEKDKKRMGKESLKLLNSKFNKKEIISKHKKLYESSCFSFTRR